MSAFGPAELRALADPGDPEPLDGPSLITHPMLLAYFRLLVDRPSGCLVALMLLAATSSEPTQSHRHRRRHTGCRNHPTRRCCACERR